MAIEFSSIKIRTPTRLHFSLIDLNGELGRIDGGLGVAIDKPNWVINIQREDQWSIPAELGAIIERLKSKIKLKDCYKIDMESTVPTHVGLGSQTQLALGVSHGLSILAGQEVNIKELATIVNRGGTSGIGVAGY